MKKLFFVLLMVVSAFSTSMAQAADCVSKSEMQTIASHFSQFKNLAKSEYCFDGSQTSNLIQTIMFMRKTSFAPNMKKSTDELFTGKFAGDWYQYFIGRISDISVQSNCPKGVGAYVYGFGSTMYVCPMMLTSTFSALDRASVFMHEARHIDGYPHTTCSRGARKGFAGACDSRISEGGSYAVSVETYAQLAKYATDVHPALKAYALASAVTYADEAFEVPVKIEREEKILIMANDKQMYSWNPSQLKLETLGQAQDLGKIILRAQTKAIIPTDRSKNAGYFFFKNEGSIEQVPGDIIAEYNTQTPQVRAQLMDLHLGAQWNARIYTDKITFMCNVKTNDLESITIPEGTAVNVLYLNGYTRTDRSQYLLTSTGKVFEFGCPETRNPRAFIREATNAPQGILRTYKAQEKNFGLTQDGSLVELNGNQQTMVPTGLDGQIYEIAPLESYRFMDSN